MRNYTALTYPESGGQASQSEQLMFYYKMKQKQRTKGKTIASFERH